MFATVIGVRFMAGKSKKSGNEFEMVRALVLRPVESFKRSDLDVQALGFEAVEVPLSQKGFEQMKTAKFPLQCELSIEQTIGRGGVESVITGYQAPAPLKSAAQG